MTSSPADASVSPATNGRTRVSLAMAASCSESKPSQNRTVLNQATTRSASAVKVASGTSITCSGLSSKAELERARYPIGIKVTDEQLATVNMTTDELHGDWNYSIQPEKRKKWRLL